MIQGGQPGTEHLPAANDLVNIPSMDELERLFAGGIPEWLLRGDQPPPTAPSTTEEGEAAPPSGMYS